MVRRVRIPLSRLRERVGVRGSLRLKRVDQAEPTPLPALRATFSRKREKGDLP